MKKILFAIIVIIILVYVVYSNTENNRVLAPFENDSQVIQEQPEGEDVLDEKNPYMGTIPTGIFDNGELCEIVRGNWDAIHNECLGIDQVTCTKIGGIFNECASACRHDPNAEFCTMECVQVCELK